MGTAVGTVVGTVVGIVVRTARGARVAFMVRFMPLWISTVVDHGTYV
ncbi:MAG: hypothetical protein QMD46_06525 [Methanomicrobiales archaeon]|nr:hypothetical protein [Methanomicrobiales archaeon]MDI6877650.1 hypothetical protein [Methanomicrobiales archaeon]